MQAVSAGFTAEQEDLDRKIAHNLLVSWKKESTLGNQTFTIGVSVIGGTGVIGINPGAIGSPGIYKYFDESDYVNRLAWERQLSLPEGGLSMGLAEAQLSNTSRRFTPNFMRGDSELFTSILPSRPVIINAGFNFDGIDQVLPQFSGLLSRQPKVGYRNALADLQISDYVRFFQNKYVDNESMYTSQRSDVVIENLLRNSGMSTAQYSLDEGLNTINFGVFQKGDKFADIIHKIVSAEYGHFYQDEMGVFRFENRQHWDTNGGVQEIIYTAQVLDAEAPGEDHIINVVEIKSSPRAKQESQMVFKLSSPIEILTGQTVEYWVNFDDPMAFLSSPVYEANAQEDGEGSDLTSSVILNSATAFTSSAKYVFTNNAISTAYITSMTITGRPAKVTGELYYRDTNSASVTAYDERPYVIENDYIQDISWARSFATLILADFANPENLQNIMIRAMPTLQLGDLISWQGLHWRVYGIKARLDPSEGFIQDLKLVKRIVRQNFTIGVSLIGGADIIAA